MRIGLFYNLKSHFELDGDAPKDALNEFDDPETIADLSAAFAALGHTVVDLQNPICLTNFAQRTEIDLAFSICEMEGFRFRESLVPALCELLRLPYVFAPPDAMVIGLDKNLANFVTRQSGLLVPDWRYIRNSADLSSLPTLHWPQIVKLSAEGSSMGFDPTQSIVVNDASLTARAEKLLTSYHQPVIVQTVVTGREFTVGVIERDGQPYALEPLEVKLHGKVPAELSAASRSALRASAEVAFTAIGCRDAARIDFILDESGVANFLECNAIPYFGAENGYFAQSASRMGIPYVELIANILASATSRFPILSKFSNS